MKAFRTLGLLLGMLLGTASLSPAAAPLAGSNPTGHGPAYAQGVVAELDGVIAVDNYIREALPFCPPCIRMRVADSIDGTDLYNLLIEYRKINGLRVTEARKVGEELVMRFEYDERVRVMALYRRFVDGAETAWLYEGPLYADEAHLRSEEKKETARERRTRIKKRKRRNKKVTTSYSAAPCPELSDLREACCYLISAMPYCPGTVEFICKEKLNKEKFMELEKAADSINRSLLGRTYFPQHDPLIPCGSDESIPLAKFDHVIPTKCRAQQDVLGKVVIAMEHETGVKFLSVYRKQIPESRLTEEELASYQVACEIVDWVKELHPMEYHRAVALHDICIAAR